MRASPLQRELRFRAIIPCSPLAAAGRVKKKPFFHFLKNFLFSFVSKPDNLNKMQSVLRKRGTRMSHTSGFCAVCGTPIGPEVRFCPNCGTPAGRTLPQNVKGRTMKNRINRKSCAGYFIWFSILFSVIRRQPPKAHFRTKAANQCPHYITKKTGCQGVFRDRKSARGY